MGACVTKKKHQTPLDEEEQARRAAIMMRIYGNPHQDPNLVSQNTNPQPESKQIKSIARLKQSSVKLTPKPDSQEFSIDFEVTSETPAKLTIYFFVKETLNAATRKTAYLGNPRYPPPQKVEIPQGEDTQINNQVSITPFEFTPQELFFYDRMTYPLIFELVPEETNQAQVTYFRFSRGTQGLELKPIKQIFVCDGVKYNLMEVYGLATSEEEDECVICMSAKRTTGVMPCRHLCFCTECSQMMRNQRVDCPVCRNRILSFFLVKK